MEKNTDIKTTEELLNKTFPKAKFEYYDNFDDVFCGWDICPKPGIMIRFGISLYNSEQINICLYKINTLDDTLEVRRLFSGYVPKISPNEIDFKFIETLLTNYDKIG